MVISAKILPVVKNGKERKIIDKTIKFSELWPFWKVLKLNKNVRCIDKEFSELLLKIGDVKIENFIIPESWKTDDVCSKIYGNVNNNNIENSVILTPHNKEIDQMNSKFLKLMNGKLHTYYSVDYATYKRVDEADDNIYLNFKWKLWIL